MAGASGFLGTAWRDHLARQGHEVVRLVRGQAMSDQESQWDPHGGTLDRSVIEKADVVACLSGSAKDLAATELFAAPDEPGDDEGWYEEDLVGLSVVVDGARVGAVTGLVTGEVQDLLQVTLDSGSEALVPFVEEIVPEVDLDAGIVILDPPPGLLTLNEQEPGQP